MSHIQTRQFDPSDLLSVLSAALRTDTHHPDDGTGVQRLFEELILSKQYLVKLFDVGPRSEQERRELEGGQITVNNRPLAVNADFARQVAFVSSQLDVSERYVAGLLQSIISQHPNLTSSQQVSGSEKLVEAAIIEFHSKRRKLAECLQYIVEAAVLGQQGVNELVTGPGTVAGGGKSVYEQLELFVRQEMIAATAQQTAPASGLGGLFRGGVVQQAPGQGAFPTKLLKEIDRLGETLQKVQAAKQNARSDTVGPSQTQAGSLGSDILSARLSSLHAERRALGSVLVALCRLGYVAPANILDMIDWLQKNAHERNPLVLYVLVGVMNCWEIVDPNSDGGTARKLIINDAQFIGTLKRKLNPSTTAPGAQQEWRAPGLRAVLLLKWTLFLTEMRHRDPSLEDKDGFKTDELENQIWNGVQGDSFSWLTRIMMTVHAKSGNDSNVLPTSYLSSGFLARFENEPLPISGSDVDEDFSAAFLDAVESLIRWTITYASSELRKIKQRQEDVLLSGVRGDRLLRSSASHTRQFSTPAEPTVNASGPPPRNDIGMLFSLIGILYTLLPPERALQFWGGGIVPIQPVSYGYMALMEANAGRLPSFLQWAVWSTQIKDVDMLAALYDMLVGLSKGQQCSELTYNFLARGGIDSGLPIQSQQGPAVSWNAIFGLLDQWTATASTPRSNQPPPQMNLLGQQTQRQHQAHPQPLILTPQDVLLAQSFLRLLGSVARYSVAVRTTLSGHARFRPIPTLVSLVPLNIPLELKGALFDSLASFCLPGAGVPGVEICRSVWTLMERMEVINVRANAVLAGPSIAAVKGVEVELEEVEAVHKMYPETIPFLKLLSTLIHAPKSISTHDLVTDSEPLNTIPETLGQSYRTPGIGPYTSFVVDKVFAKISQREYLRPADRWRINDLCLTFIENTLASFDLESLVTSQEEASTQTEALIALAIHPGHDILKRMLTHSELQASILSYAVDGLDGFDKGFAEEEPLFAKTITRSLRIVQRVLELQDIFFDLFVPALSSLEDAAAIGEIHPVSYYVRFDQALLYGPQSVPALAAYISYPAYPELRLLSVKILSTLATPSNVSQLAVIIDKSSDSDRILDGYQHVLDTESFVDVDTAETFAEECTGAGAPDVSQSLEVLTQAIRLAVLDFFNQNIQPGRPYPNVAHLLLFGKIQSENQIQDPNALGARRACIHAILDILNQGVPRLGEDVRSHQAQRIPGTALTSRLPAFAERCYRVILQLCRHSRTSEFSMRYLRSREDFFTRHLAALPFHLSATFSEPYIEIEYNDSSRVISTVPALTASLRLRSAVFDLVALELHVLTSRGHSKSVIELLDLLYGNDDEGDRIGPNWADDMFRPFRDVGQSHLRMIEFLQSLDFDWSDSLMVHPIPLEFFGHLNLCSCVQLDDSGCEIVDKSALISLLTHARRSLHQQGRIVTTAHLQQVSDETAYIMQSCAVENHRRQVQHATMVSYESWQRLLEMTLVKCLEKVAPQRREGLLFDLLHVLPAALLSGNTPEPTAAILAEAILSTITKLREDRHQQTVTQFSSQGVSALPAERLFALLRSLLQCLTNNSQSEIVRGNLYASLVNYISLITDVEERPQNALGWTEDLSSDVDKSSWGSNGAPLVDGSMAIIKPVMDRLVALVSRDATDGTEVWKTVAFVFLDSLVRLSHIERRVDVLSALGRPGFITSFARSLKETDLHLQIVLKPDPDDLNPLYIFESKMSLLCRMAQSRGGAERLIESRLIPSLADSDFIDARPELDQAFVDNDSFLPSATQRYHQLLLPSLQAVAGIISSLGCKHLTATNQVLEFLRSHRDTFVILLKTDIEDLSMSVLEEMRLVISLGSNILSVVPKTELVSTSGYGGVHAAIISLAARTLGKRTWATAVKPSNEDEAFMDSIRDPAHGVSKFRVKVLHQLIHLRKAVISYMGNTSNFTEHEFTPILSPIVGIPRQDDITSRFIVTIPTAGDAIDTLNHILEDLAQTLKQFLDFSAELASQDHALENIPEMLELPSGVVLENLTVDQRQTLIDHELQKWQRSARAKAHTLFESLEMLLLLVWRHLAVYADEGADVQNLGVSIRITPSFNADSFRTDASRKLAPVVHRLSAMATENQLGLGWQSYERYMEVMSRRLKDAAGLHDAQAELSPEEDANPAYEHS
ncbi:nucleoporin Nup186/Nup192/Nup205 [Irpex rosettiformis]|uniref:Nucleoporin Nup186/Nup192/Nup205 n=1 Tax=Irpex rosettiformis TaxID=378272 RepID=A0ACB8TUV9_9APHY|nr:nucleoporin Nup186/Nup192/Nup205 [Irpex rosettiformis]